MFKRDPSIPSMFIGKEVEHTVAFGQPTLFVSGFPRADLVHKALYDHPEIRQIYLAANQSYHCETPRNWAYIAWFLQQLKMAAQCVIAIDVPFVALQEFRLELNALRGVDYERLIIQVSIDISAVEGLPKNTYLKIDDNVRRVTNPGVWTYKVRALLEDKATFTPWSAYRDDKVIHPQVEP